MNGVFFMVGPTATGKSELAADVARKMDAEIVSADAFQLYQGLDLLTAKPEAVTLEKAPHHLVGTVPLSEEMNVERFRGMALEAINLIQRRGKRAIVVGGSGLYIKALTHGLSALPVADPALRAELNSLSAEELSARLKKVDPETAATIDMKNRRRVVRALEIFITSGRSAAAQRTTWQAASAHHAGIFVLRDREDLFRRIDRRVEAMFDGGVVDQVRAAGKTSKTAEKMLGLSEIRALVAGRLTRSECVAAMQQATRRYAKRQLTWFRRQSNFESLNLSPLNHASAVEWITERALSLSRNRDDRNAA
jgi:tRNA dimethylallyltransferase